MKSSSLSPFNTNMPPTWQLLASPVVSSKATWTSVEPSNLYTMDRKTLGGTGTCRENNLEERNLLSGEEGLQILHQPLPAWAICLACCGSVLAFSMVRLCCRLEGLGSNLLP